MQDLLDSLGRDLGTQRKKRDELAARHSRAYKCRCGNHIFFDNTLCLACKSPLGLLPDVGQVATLDPGPAQGTWRVDGRKELLKFCANRDSQAACNWMMYARNPKTYCIASCDCAERRPALDAEALSRLRGTVARVKELTAHPAFTLKNPNKVYALLGSFGANQVNFHASDGSGYQLMVEQSLALDSINPQVASRLVRNFERYKRFEPQRRALMRAALEKVAAAPGLSKETAEVVGKALA